MAYTIRKRRKWCSTTFKGERLLVESSGTLPSDLHEVDLAEFGLRLAAGAILADVAAASRNRAEILILEE